ncbi:unnamed protein product, partial [Mesorhabditis belari]|uniref:Sushi domain-containing protein n=1 Tax=Mesorhabditis belari TaxID=2138241 RepID=A0AAF3J5C0_9BILA
MLFKHFIQLFLLFSKFSLLNSQLCPSSDAPKDLAAVSVWLKDGNGTGDGTGDVYRISDEDLTDKGYVRSPKDRDNFVVLMARSAGGCVNGCSAKIGTNQRDDGQINHLENILGAPYGFTDLHDNLFCGRTLGACGADVQIFKYFQGNGKDTTFAYSLDPSARFPGMTRDLTFSCFGWSDGGSVVHPAGTEHNCMKLLDVEHGKVHYSTPGSGAFSLGTAAHTICDSGFSATGQTQVLCTKKGWFPASLGGCVQQSAKPRGISLLNVAAADGPSITHGSSECAAIGKVSHGSLLYSAMAKDARYPNLSTVTLFCDLAYVAVGEVTSTCKLGLWSPPIGECVSSLEIHCQPMLVPLNGRISYSSSNGSKPLTEGASASLACDQGYIVRGVQNVSCHFRQWSNLIGSCEKLNPNDTEIPLTVVKRQSNCPQVSADNGQIILNGFGNQLSANLNCNLGFVIQGAGASFCQNGAWIPELGSCVSGTSIFGVNSGNAGGQCMDIQLITAVGTVNYSSSAANQRPSLSTASLSCPSGFSAQGALTATCNNGVWIPTTLGACISSTLVTASVTSTVCPNLALLNGNLTYSTPNLDSTKPIGSQVYLSCIQGTNPVGPTQSICQNGGWSPALGSCQGSPSFTISPSLCPSLLPPLFGTLNYSQPGQFGAYPTGTSVSLNCSTGSVIGTSQSECLNGGWQPAGFGSCPLTTINKDAIGIRTIRQTGGQCTAITSATGGTVNYSNGPFGPFNSGTTANITCFSGFVQGSQFTTCTNGQWSPQLGFCSSTSNPGGSGTTCPFAPLIPMGANPIYSTGSSAGPFYNGASVTITCPMGQSVSGSAITTCTNGQWSYLGTCSTSGTGVGQCPFAPLAPFNGNLSYPSSSSSPPFSSGSTINLQCSSSTRVLGSSTTTCQAESPQRRAPVSSCLSMASPPSSKIKYYTNSTGFYSNGTVAELECELGWTPAGDRLATCLNGHWVPERMGVCIPRNVEKIVEKLCSFPVPPVLNGEIGYSQKEAFGGFISGTRASLKCSHGFEAQGNVVSTCISGKWIPSTMSPCDPRMPEIFRSPAERSINEKSVDGKCSALPLKTHSSITYSIYGFGPYDEKTVATISCHLGTLLDGEPSTLCINGDWTPKLGDCISPINAISNRIQSDVGEIDRSGEELEESTTKITESCSPPYSPGFGEVTFSKPSIGGEYPEGTIAALRCNMGYLANGPTFSRCSFGSFRPVLGGCTSDLTVKSVEKCSPIKAPPHSKVTYIQSSRSAEYEEGTTALLYCDIGYLVAGQPSLVCSSDGWRPLAGFGTCQKPYS